MQITPRTGDVKLLFCANFRDKVNGFGVGERLVLILFLSQYIQDGLSCCHLQRRIPLQW